MWHLLIVVLPTLMIGCRARGPPAWYGVLRNVSKMEDGAPLSLLRSLLFLGINATGVGQPGQGFRAAAVPAGPAIRCRQEMPPTKE